MQNENSLNKHNVKSQDLHNTYNQNTCKMTITANMLIRYGAFLILALFHYSLYDPNICKISFDMHFHTDSIKLFWMNTEKCNAWNNNKCIMRFSFGFSSQLSLDRKQSRILIFHSLTMIFHYHLSYIALYLNFLLRQKQEKERKVNINIENAYGKWTYFEGAPPSRSSYVPVTISRKVK